MAGMAQSTRLRPAEQLSNTIATRRVFVRGLEIIASVGVYEHEKRKLQRLVVSLELLVSDTYDGHSDQLGDVYDYDLAIAAAEQALSGGHTNLLETVAERIAANCLLDARVRQVTVRIEKPDVEAPCDSVGIEIVRPL